MSHKQPERGPGCEAAVALPPALGAPAQPQQLEPVGLCVVTGSLPLQAGHFKTWVPAQLV